MGVGVGVGEAVGLADGDGDADVAAAVGDGGGEEWAGATLVWCTDGVEDGSEVGEPHGLARPGVLQAVGEGVPGPLDVGLFTSSTEVPLVVSVDLCSRLPLR